MRIIRSLALCVVCALALAACSAKGVVNAASVKGTTANTAISGNTGTTASTSPPATSATTTTTTAGPSGIETMGTTVTTPVTFDGIVSATVFGFYPNITSTQPDVDQPPSGDSYGAVDAQECAGSQGAGSGADESDFTILLSNGSTAETDTLGGNPTVAPLSSESELGSGGQGLSAGQCDRGWIVFDIPSGVTPTYVQFTGTTAGTNPDTVAKWTIPAG